MPSIPNLKDISQFVAGLLTKKNPEAPQPALGDQLQNINPPPATQDIPGLITNLPQTPSSPYGAILGKAQGSLQSQPTNQATRSPQDDALAGLQSTQDQINLDKKKAQGQYDTASGSFRTTPTPNLGEALGGIIAQFTGPHTAGAYTKATEAPFQLASQRMALQNQQSEQQMNAARAVLGETVTRQDALDRTKATIVNKMAVINAKANADALKTNAQFAASVLKISGTQGVSIGSIKAAYMAAHPDAKPEEADQFAQMMGSDPSFANTLKQTHEQAIETEHSQKIGDMARKNDQASLLATIEAAHKDTVPVGQSRFGLLMGAKVQATEFLNKYGYDPTGMASETPASITSMSSALSGKDQVDQSTTNKNQTEADALKQKMEQSAEMFPVQKQTAYAKLGLDRVTMGYIAEKTRLYPEAIQAQIADRMAHAQAGGSGLKAIEDQNTNVRYLIGETVKQIDNIQSTAKGFRELSGDQKAKIQKLNDLLSTYQQTLNDNNVKIGQVGQSINPNIPGGQVVESGSNLQGPITNKFQLPKSWKPPKGVTVTRTVTRHGR